MTTEAASPPAREVLALGGAPADRRLRRTLLVIGVVAVLILGGLLGWRLWPRPVDPLTLAELQGVYAGMVRSDGTNDASVIERRNAPRTSAVVDPAVCAPLFDTTLGNQLPADALDGVGTYWFNQRGAVSLSTLRFADAATADRAYTRVTEALTACADRRVTVGRTALRPGQAGTVSRTIVTPTADARAQTGYLFSLAPGRGDAARYAVHALLLENTVTWQFRYEPAPDAYDPLAAQQLMDGLVAQIISVVDLRTR